MCGKTFNSLYVAPACKGETNTALRSEPATGKLQTASGLVWQGPKSRGGAWQKKGCDNREGVGIKRTHRLPLFQIQKLFPIWKYFSRSLNCSQHPEQVIGADGACVNYSQFPSFASIMGKRTTSQFIKVKSVYFYHCIYYFSYKRAITSTHVCLILCFNTICSHLHVPKRPARSFLSCGSPDWTTRCGMVT